MTITADKHAAPIVHRFVLNMNTLLSSIPVAVPERKGMKLAAKRYAAKFKANKQIAVIDRPDSRQVRRRKERFAAKSLLSASKQHSLKANLKGGAASVYA